MTHYYAWRNNPKRATLCGRKCRVVTRGKMNSALIELENGQPCGVGEEDPLIATHNSPTPQGQREVVSRWALRRL